MSTNRTYIGFEVLWNGLAMNLKMWMKIFLAQLVLQAFVFAAVMAVFTNSGFVPLMPTIIFAKLLHLAGLDSFPLPIYWDGWGIAKVGNIVNNAGVEKVYNAVAGRSWLAFICSFVALLIWPAGLNFFNKRSSKLTGEEHIRGPQLLTAPQLNDEIHSTGKKTHLPLGPVDLPFDYEPEHIFIAGKTRVGKTVAMLQMVERIRKSGHKAIIYDFKGDYVEKFFDEKKDKILNFLDPRGVGWSVANDVLKIYDVETVASSLIPPAIGEADKFWNQAARDVFAGILAHCISTGKRSNADIWAAVSAPIKDIAAMMETTEIGKRGLVYIQDASSKQALSVVAVMMSFVSFFQYAGLADGDFSIQKWLKEPGGGFIFITGQIDIRDTLRPYMSLFVDLFGKKALSLFDNSGGRRVYVVLDEFGSLQRLNIKELLTAAGSRGIITIIGIQDQAQVVKVYGREDATTIFNSCGTCLILNVNDPDTAKFFQQRLGERQYWQANLNDSMGTESGRDGLTVSRQKVTEPVVMASEIQNLKKLELFISIPEHNPARTTLAIKPINDKLPVAKAFILREGLDIKEIYSRELRVIAEAITAKLAKDAKPAQEQEAATAGTTDAPPANPPAISVEDDFLMQ